jgi:hypothetical protein
MKSDSNLLENTLEQQMRNIISQYRESFTDKTYSEENNDSDVLMEVFGITPELKRENRQYWGRELGMCWQLLISQLCEIRCDNFKPALRIEADEPTDLFIGKDAIDTKYRIGSGDSGTLKKFKKYGALLREQGYNPVLIILRKDNLPAALTACNAGGWKILTGEDSFLYLQEKTKYDFFGFLTNLKGQFDVNRNI